jgi:Thioesterase superfamily
MIAHPQSIHRYTLRVYYEDTDAGGVVYHATYLRYAERARTEALRDAGIPHADLVERFGLMFMVHRAEIDYVRAAVLDAGGRDGNNGRGRRDCSTAPDGTRPQRGLRDAAHQARLRPNRRKQTGPNPVRMAGRAGWSAL